MTTLRVRNKRIGKRVSKMISLGFTKKKSRSKRKKKRKEKKSPSKQTGIEMTRSISKAFLRKSAISFQISLMDSSCPLTVPRNKIR